MKIKEGFKGERYIFIPEFVVNKMKEHIATRDLYLTHIGYFPHALYHHRMRTSGANEHIFIYCTKGKGWYKVNHCTYQIVENQYFTIPKGVKHSYGSSESDPWSLYWVHFDGTKADYFSKVAAVPQKIATSPNSRINERLEIFEEMLSTILSGYSEDKLMYACACLYHFICTIHCLEAFRALSTEHNKKQLLMNSAIHYMSENLEKRITLNEIAEYLGISTGYFSTCFSKIAGVSPINYFNNMKIKHSCKLLETSSLKVIEISNKLGFDDPYYFTRLFTKAMGVSPVKYRKAASKAPMIIE